MFKGIEVANYFIKLAREEGLHISNMKLQKLVYIAHGYYWGYFDKPLIDEAPQAWQHGPVIKSVYDAFKSNGADNINDFGTLMEVTDKFDLRLSQPVLEETDHPEIARFLKAVWNGYKKLSAIQLSNLTHQEGSPWSLVVSKYIEDGIGIPHGTSIDSEVIEEYYKNKIAQFKSNEEVNSQPET